MKVLLRQWKVVLTGDATNRVFTPAACDEPSARGVASAVFGIDKVIRVVDEGTFDQRYGAQPILESAWVLDPVEYGFRQPSETEEYFEEMISRDRRGYEEQTEEQEQEAHAAYEAAPKPQVRICSECREPIIDGDPRGHKQGCKTNADVEY